MGKETLLKIVELTDGWVIVTVFLLIVVGDLVKKHMSNKVTYKTQDMLEKVISSILNRISQDISELNQSINSLLKYTQIRK